VAQRLDRDVPELFRPSLALNAILDRPPPAEAALAVEPRRPGARTYFVHPWKGRIFAGTHHAAWRGGPDEPTPPEEAVQMLLEDLDAALPTLELRREHVLRLRWGFLPAKESGSDVLAVRPVLRRHAEIGGPAGLLSVSGVKFTTARDVAERTLQVVLDGRIPPRAGTPRPPSPEIPTAEELDVLLATDKERVRSIARTLIREEAVVGIDDLVLRRTDWGVDPRREREMARVLGDLFEERAPGEAS
jgi:glycerol-3-phosphate dehydrogenase